MIKHNPCYASNELTMDMMSKSDSFIAITTESGKILFECKICGCHLATKQTMLKHLHVMHQMSPVKKVNKLYLADPSFPVPKSTYYRHAANEMLLYNAEGIGKPMSIEDVSNATVSPEVEPGCIASLPEQHECHMLIDNSIIVDEFEADSENVDSCSLYSNRSVTSTDSARSFECDSERCESESDSYFEHDSDSTDETVNGRNKQQQNVMSRQNINSMCYLSCITRHNLTECCANDILQLIRVVSQDPNQIALPQSYKATVQSLSDVKYQSYHYCNICEEMFPEDKDIYKCQTIQCTGFRYKGSENDQMLPSRQPSSKFIINDIESQLVTLLSNTVVWSDIQKTKETILYTQDDYMHGTRLIYDVTDGECYRSLCRKGQFLANPNAISGIFNTDGIPLYSSTKEKLWPLFLAVNEDNIERRFLRENMILAGIWQGKKNPPFFHYLSAFSEAISKLYFDGFLLRQGIHVKFGLLLASVDLQAKSYVANMTMHNGAYGCVTCEEPGETAISGRGHARHYPYRKIEDKYPTRIHDDFIAKSINATKKKRNLGICGPSGLKSLPSFDLIVGMVPDYMHCVLLGVTKSLLMKHFSPTNSGKPYFIGKSLDHISRRLKSIKPPDYFDRLPRDLAANYHALKASELQAWLLYYCVPCLRGYLRHLASLSEGIYICLSDSISDLELKRAQTLLDSFYKDFALLYGEGSCGLNVHNVGAHLCFYVKQWGPLFGWSCFGFEDGNAELLSFAHGTGDVTQQLIRGKDVRISINSLSHGEISESEPQNFLKKMNKRHTRRWEGGKSASNCIIAASTASVTVPINSTADFIMAQCGVHI